MQVPEELKDYACDEISLENGDYMCTDGFKGGTICMALCAPGYIKRETGANNKRKFWLKKYISSSSSELKIKIFKHYF